MVGKKIKLITVLMAIVLILSQVSAFAVTDTYALEIGGSGVKTQIKLSVADLKDMPEEAKINEDYLYNSKTGEKISNVKGVSLSYVLKELAGVTADNAEILFEALDGYAIDPQSLQDIFNEDLQYVIAYEVDGEQVNDDDIAENEDVRVYRKQKEAGEFGTVFKLVCKITVGDEIEVADDNVIEDEILPIDVEQIFSDITEEFKYAQTAISELAKKGIISGMGDGIYGPEQEFNRAQFCKIIVESLDYELKSYVGGFSDVATNAWYGTYVQAAVESGLFLGYEDGTFMPDKTITRQEIALVAARAAVASGKLTQEKLEKFVMDKSEYLDKADVPTWAANAVAWLEAQDVFVDIVAEKFESTKVVNRAEAAVVVFNTLFKE